MSSIFVAHSWRVFLLSCWKARKWPSELRRKVAINFEMFSNFYHFFCVKSINIINFSTEAPQLQWTVQFKPGANGIAKDCCTSGGWRWTQGGHFFNENGSGLQRHLNECCFLYFPSIVGTWGISWLTLKGMILDRFLFCATRVRRSLNYLGFRKQQLYHRQPLKGVVAKNSQWNFR